MTFKSILIVLLSLVFITSSFGQFGRLKNKLLNDVADKMEDRLIDQLSDVIAERAYRSIEKAVDDWAKETYGADTTSTGEVDWDKLNASLEESLGSLNKAADLPASYDFDISMDVEVRDYENEKHSSKLHYIKDKAIWGYEQMEKGDKTMIVMDTENDLMAIYTVNKKGEKSGQALPSAMTLGKTLITMADAEEEFDMVIQKTGKTKSYAGYKADGYKAESDDEYMEVYTTTDLPINWTDAYGKFIEDFAPKAYAEMTNQMKGMVMYSENVRKENKKQKSSWEVKKVSQKGFTINNSEWEFKGLAEK